MGVNEGDLQIGIDIDVILENCTITTWYCYTAYLTKYQHPPCNVF